MKKPAKKSSKTKAAAKKSVKKPAPAPKAKKAVDSGRREGAYTPQPIQGIGWAPFRYPLS